MSEVNRLYKDRIFSLIFGREENKAWTLSLFNAINESNFTNSEDIHIETIDDFIYMSMKNDVAFIIGDYINLYEHQSTFNPNMPLRELVYLSKLYEKLIKRNKMNVYSGKQLILPAPRFIVFYNGEQEKEDEILKLSDSFPEEVKEKSDIEVSVKMLNINYGHNKELMDKCDALKQYSLFISHIRKYCESHELDEAVKRSIDDMPEGGLKTYFEGHRAEVLQMLFTEYNEKEHMDAVRAEGKEEGVDMIVALHSALVKDNRLEDLKKSFEDKEYQTELLKEYGIYE